MKRLIALTFTLITLTSCSFISDSEVENNNKTTPSISTTSTWTTRKIKNIKKPRTNSWTAINTGSITNMNAQMPTEGNATSPTSQDETTPTWSSIEELSKINISEASIDTDSWTTETWWIEDVSEEQVSQLVDILLEAWK